MPPKKSSRKKTSRKKSSATSRRSNPSRASCPKKSLDENAGFSQIDKELFYDDLIDDSSDKVSSDEQLMLKYLLRRELAAITEPKPNYI